METNGKKVCLEHAHPDFQFTGLLHKPQAEFF